MRITKIYLMLTGIAAVGFVSVCVTTIEKRFNYKSRDSGQFICIVLTLR